MVSGQLCIGKHLVSVILLTTRHSPLTESHHYIFQHGLSVKHSYDTMTVTSIVFTRGNHYDRSSLFFLICMYGLFFVPVTGVMFSGWLVGKDKFRPVNHCPGNRYT